MKLIDLFEAAPMVATKDFAPRKAGKIPIITVARSPRIKGSVVDSGAQAQVQSFPKQPGTIIKYADVHELSDPYLHFLNIILDHQDNPFFPRIHKVKLYDISFTADISGADYKLVVQMEKLHPVDQSNLSDSADAILRSLGLDGEKNMATDNFSVFRIFDDPKALYKLRRATNNPKFAEALALLEPHFEEYGNDMHNGNFMIRLTSTGPQIVIIDPFDYQF